MLGPIIPPSIMLIIYGHVAELSIATLWFAGIVPGILTGLILMAYIYWEVARKRIKSPDPKPFSLPRAWKSFLQNIFVVLLPILLLWTILTGVATPTETGVIACLYTFILSVAFKGKAFLRKMPEVLMVSAKSSGLIMFIIATATIFVWVMTVEQTAVMLSESLLSLTDNKYLLLLIINLFLLIIGAFLEQIPAMLIVVPLMAPIPIELGISPIQFGIMVVFNLMIGMITPPMGMALYIMGAITDVPMRDIIIYSMRFFLALLIALLLITYIPFISTFVPNLLGMSMY
jgi:tripartite ATP-independent transporter DctM subunit